MKLRVAVLVLALAISYKSLHSQDTVSAVAGPEYAAGAIKRLFLGSHYRNVWAAPVWVPVFDPMSQFGGLEPVCVGGGRFTRSLRMRNHDGREYVFRQLHKEPVAALLPTLLLETFAGTVLEDQASSSHPTAPLAVVPLAEALDLLHAPPRLMYMPDTPWLGQFTEQFGGTLGQVEERPNELPGDRPGFAGSDDIESTPNFWNELEDLPINQVAVEEYLTARLLDLVIGDWDRHYDQWRWARFDTPSGSVWRPIPRDRDQAFARFDGLAARVVRHYWPQLVEFESSYPSISGLTFAGRALDRRLLPVLEWHTWDSLVTAVQTRLTDQVLARAVEAIPPGHRELGGAEIAAFLHTRRDGLREAAREFYRLLAHQADVHATDHDEIATVTRLSEGDVRIEVRLAGAARPYLTRTYEKSDTHELRIYMHGGDDTVVLDGEVRTPIVLRIIGGGGSDRFLDLAAASNVGVTRFYDRGDRTQFDVKGPIDRSTWRPTGGADVIIPSSGSCNEGAIDTLPRDLVEPLRDWGNTIVGMPWLSYRTDVGLVVGGGFVYTRYGFRRSPYDYRLRVVGGVLTNDRDGFAETELRVPAGADGVAFNFLVRYSGVDFTRFHGLGNRTTSTREPDFYRVQQQLFEFLPSVRLRLDRSGAAQISIGASVKHQNTRSDSTTILGITQPYGLGGFGELGAVLSFDLDLRDHPVFPTRGLRLKGRATFYPRFWDVARRFGGFEGRAAMYLRARLPLQPVLALRAGGKWLWGRFPFHEAAYIGGSSTLRGFRRMRFAGDASAFGSAELRLSLGRAGVLLPTNMGVLLYGDAGRVFLAGDPSDLWHTAVGGGLWYSFLGRRGTVSASIARSTETTKIYVDYGFAF